MLTENKQNISYFSNNNKKWLYLGSAQNFSLGFITIESHVQRQKGEPFCREEKEAWWAKVSKESRLVND